MTEVDPRRANIETQEAWDANAAFWDARMGEGNDFFRVLVWPAAVRLLGLQAGERVLDIACGNGLTSRRMAEMGAEVVAFDFSPEMIAHARARTEGLAAPITYHVMDGTDAGALLALSDGRFDAALCNMALFDMADIRPLLSTLPQLLRPGGRFVFSITHPCFNNPHVVQMAEQEDREGEIVTIYSVKVRSYLSSTVSHGLAMRGQPRPQLYFHRSLQELLGHAFVAGFVLSGLEERAFAPDHPPSQHPLSWGPSFAEIPPVLVARLNMPA